MSNRRRPQLKQEVNINLSRYVTLCISFIEQDGYSVEGLIAQDTVEVAVSQIQIQLIKVGQIQKEETFLTRSN